MYTNIYIILYVPGDNNINRFIFVKNRRLIRLYTF